MLSNSGRVPRRASQVSALACCTAWVKQWSKAMDFLQLFSQTNIFFIAHIRENICLRANFEGNPLPYNMHRILRLKIECTKNPCNITLQYAQNFKAKECTKNPANTRFFITCVNMIFNYGKQFRFVPSFNKHIIIFFSDPGNLVVHTWYIKYMYIISTPLCACKEIYRKKKTGRIFSAFSALCQAPKSSKNHP